MKRALTVFAAIVFLLAAGCEKQNKNPTVIPPPSSFTANLSIDFAQTPMTARLTQTDSENFIIQMLSPEIMAPLRLTYTAGVCTVSYEGLEFESEPDRFPQAEFGALLTQALTSIAQDIDIQKTYSENLCTYNGIGNRGNFRMTGNAESGEWLSFEVEGAGLKIDFSDFNKK